MKTTKTHPLNVYIAGIIWFAVGYLLLAYVPTHDLLKVFYVHWLALLSAVVMCFLPVARMRLPITPTHQALSHGRWMLRIILLQLALFAIYCGIATTGSILFPTHVTAHTINILPTLNLSLTNFGLFPWGLIALFSCALGILAYRYRQHANFSDLVNPIFKCTPESQLGQSINIGMRTATTLALAFSVAFTILIVTYLITHNTALALPTGLNAASFYLCLALIVFGFTGYFKRFISKALSRQIPFVFGIAILILLCSGLMVVGSILFHGLIKYQSPTPAFLQHIYQFNAKTLWEIGSNMWWLMWVPLASLYIAKISEGRTVREMIVGILLLPLILRLLIGYVLHHVHTYTFPHLTLVICLVSIVAFMILVMLLLDKKDMAMVTINYVHKGGLFKVRDYHHFMRRIFRLALIIIYIFIPAGMNLITPALFVFVLPTSLMLLLSLGGTLKLLTKSHQQASIK